jgi:hypothetical protein
MVKLCSCGPGVWSQLDSGWAGVDKKVGELGESSDLPRHRHSVGPRSNSSEGLLAWRIGYGELEGEVEEASSRRPLEQG